MKIKPLIFLNTSSYIPGLRDKSVVVFIHRVFGNEGTGDWDNCGSPTAVAGLEGLFGLMKGASPDG